MHYTTCTVRMCSCSVRRFNTTTREQLQHQAPRGGSEATHPGSHDRPQSCKVAVTVQSPRARKADGTVPRRLVLHRRSCIRAPMPTKLGSNVPAHTPNASAIHNTRVHTAILQLPLLGYLLRASWPPPPRPTPPHPAPPRPTPPQSMQPGTATPQPGKRRG